MFAFYYQVGNMFKTTVYCNFRYEFLATLSELVLLLLPKWVLHGKPLTGEPLVKSSIL